MKALQLHYLNDTVFNKSHYTMLYKYGKRTCVFSGHFYSYFSLVFYTLGAFLIKQLLRSRLLDMRGL